MIGGKHGIQCMPCSSRLISEIFLKFIQWKILIFSNLVFILKQFNFLFYNGFIRRITFVVEFRLKRPWSSKFCLQSV